MDAGDGFIGKDDCALVHGPETARKTELCEVVEKTGFETVER